MTRQHDDPKTSKNTNSGLLFVEALSNDLRAQVQKVKREEKQANCLSHRRSRKTPPTKIYFQLQADQCDQQPEEHQDIISALIIKYQIRVQTNTMRR